MATPRSIVPLVVPDPECADFLGECGAFKQAWYKTRLANMAELGIAADNLEALALGPRLPNGKPSLIVMSDDNFSASVPPQVNQFILLEIDAPAR